MHELNKLFCKLTICAFSVFSVHANAQSVFVCSSEDGTVEYTNNLKSKNCKELKIQKSNVIPSSAKSSNSFSNKNANITLPPFPSISQNVQQQRDGDRKNILSKELDTENKKLQDLQKEYNGGMPERQGNEKNYQKYLDRVEQMKKDITRSQGNIESLKKEMGVK